MVAATIRIDLAHLLAPQGTDLLVLDDMEQLGLHVQRQLADFVEKKRSPIGLGEQPLACPVRPRKSALRMPEELALEQILGNGAAVHGNEREFAARTHFVNIAGRHPLAGPALAGDQHRAVGHGNLGNQPFHLDHRTRAEMEYPPLPGHHLAQRLVFRLQSPHRADLLDAVQQLLVAYRLDHVVGRTRPQRLDCSFHGRKSSDHHELRIDAAAPKTAHQFHAVSVGHHDVAQRDIDIAAHQLGRCLFHTGRRVDRMTGLAQRRGQNLADRRLIVNYQYMHRSASFSFCPNDSPPPARERAA